MNFMINNITSVLVNAVHGSFQDRIIVAVWIFTIVISIPLIRKFAK